MQKIIIHTQTRVIRRVTTELNPKLFADESYVEVTTPISVPPTPSKIEEDGRIVLATAQEILDSMTETEKRKIKHLNAMALFPSLVTRVNDDPDVPQSVKDFINNLSDIF